MLYKKQKGSKKNADENSEWKNKSSDKTNAAAAFTCALKCHTLRNIIYLEMVFNRFNFTSFDVESGNRSNTKI